MEHKCGEFFSWKGFGGLESSVREISKRQRFGDFFVLPKYKKYCSGEDFNPKKYRIVSAVVFQW